MNNKEAHNIQNIIRYKSLQQKYKKHQFLYHLSLNVTQESKIFIHSLLFNASNI